ncbi:hypothetical protein [Streptomyces sp. NRAIS3]
MGRRNGLPDPSISAQEFTFQGVPVAVLADPGDRGNGQHQPLGVDDLHFVLGQGPVRVELSDAATGLPRLVLRHTWAPSAAESSS